MQKVFPGLVVGSLLAVIAHGQVTVEVLLEQEQFLPGERLPVSVQIVNRSGQTLKLGIEPDWLMFNVVGKDNALVGHNGTPPVIGPFALENSKKATKTVDIAPYFSLQTPGRYEITASVQIPGWTRAESSKPKAVVISRGSKLWDVEFGVPQSSKQAEPEVRKYALMQSMRAKRMSLFARVTDASESRLVRVTEIGPLVSFSQPAHQLDRFCNLHVLWQSGARTYDYAAVNPDGLLFLHQTYDFEEQRPRLALDENGRIHVAGGERRVTSSDVPPENRSPQQGELPKN